MPGVDYSAHISNGPDPFEKFDELPDYAFPAAFDFNLEDLPALNLATPVQNLGTIIETPNKNNKTLACSYPYCNRAFSRKQDLLRHELSVHEKDGTFTCQVASCGRFIRGFPRKDKRDVHEKKMHGLRRV
jgi:hypothetical protein